MEEVAAVRRIEFSRLPGLSSFELSKYAAHLEFCRPSVRYPLRQDGLKKAVLRALCDRYPNIWPSLGDICSKTGYSLSKIRRALRELELKDRLIVDINARYKWLTDERGRRVLTAVSDGKNGGRGKNCTAQYVIKDRKIMDIYQAVRETKTRSGENTETRSGENKHAPGNRVSGLNSLRGSDEQGSYNKPSYKRTPSQLQAAPLGVRRNAPAYLNEPSRGPLTGKELEEHKREMAELRKRLAEMPEPMAASAAA